MTIILVWAIACFLLGAGFMAGYFLGWRDRGLRGED